MKNCPKCRMETRGDADWCWHCGYSYEGEVVEAEREPRQTAPFRTDSGPVQEDGEQDD
jgi:hypothetical protein